MSITFIFSVLSNEKLKKRVYYIHIYIFFFFLLFCKANKIREISKGHVRFVKSEERERERVRGYRRRRTRDRPSHFSVLFGTQRIGGFF